ncbi:MAG: FmdB family zinc ribbon protein [Chloroflexota bacterium]|nr:FmdB family zinc ribbon protein [Chloroflexota bacterium]
MPIYEYECRYCSVRFEIKRTFNDESKVICHRCGGETRRVFSPVPIIFKGPGFYCTDNAG